MTFNTNELETVYVTMLRNFVKISQGPKQLANSDTDDQCSNP